MVLIWGEDRDKIGAVRAAAEENLVPAGLVVRRVEALCREESAWEEALEKFAGDSECDCLLTVGGAGYAAGEAVPDLTGVHIGRWIPGIPEALREAGYSLCSAAALFRGIAGLTKEGKLIINLPGEESRLASSFAFLGKILPHSLDKAAGDPRDCGGLHGKGAGSDG